MYTLRVIAFNCLDKCCDEMCIISLCCLVVWIVVVEQQVCGIRNSSANIDDKQRFKSAWLSKCNMFHKILEITV